MLLLSLLLLAAAAANCENEPYRRKVEVGQNDRIGVKTTKRCTSGP